MVRKLAAAGTLVGLVAVGAPASLPANTSGSIAGHALDAGGRPLANIPVEIFEAAGIRPVGRAVRATVTDLRGAWSFGQMSAGDYVVRVTRGPQVAGVPVSVVAAESLDGVLIVAPSVFSPYMQATAGVAAAAGGLSAAETATIVAVGVAASVGTVVVLRDES